MDSQKKDEQPLTEKAALLARLDKAELLLGLPGAGSELSLEVVVRALEAVEAGLNAAGAECLLPGCVSDESDCVRQERKLHRDLELTVHRLLGLLRAVPVPPSWEAHSVLPAATEWADCVGCGVTHRAHVCPPSLLEEGHVEPAKSDEQP